MASQLVNLSDSGRPKRTATTPLSKTSPGESRKPKKSSMVMKKRDQYEIKIAGLQWDLTRAMGTVAHQKKSRLSMMESHGDETAAAAAFAASRAQVHRQFKEAEEARISVERRE